MVVEVHKQATHRQEEEIRWAAEVQAAKKEAQTLREGMAQVKEDARTQQEDNEKRREVCPGLGRTRVWCVGQWECGGLFFVWICRGHDQGDVCGICV